MKKTTLLCLLALVLPVAANAAARRDRTELHAFIQENRCPSSGLAEKSCPGWSVGYIVPLCNGGVDTRENMRWLTTEDKRIIKSATGKNCKNLRSTMPGLQPRN